MLSDWLSYKFMFRACRTGISQRYLSISHTMCPFIFDNASWPHDADLSPLPIFYIDVFTHSKQSITYSVNVEPVQDFVIRFVCYNSSIPLAGMGRKVQMIIIILIQIRSICHISLLWNVMFSGWSCVCMDYSIVDKHPSAVIWLSVCGYSSEHTLREF